MIRILASAGPGEIRLAALDDDTLQDFALWRPGAPDGLGDTHIGRVIARVPAMAGAFVALDGADGFLPDTDGGAAPEGSSVCVRIVRTAQGGKGPRLAAVPGTAEALKPPHLAGCRLLSRGPSPLARLLRTHEPAEVLVDDAALFAQLRLAIPGLRLVSCAFDDILEAEIEALASAHVDLPGGMRATITPTPALTAIDMDGGTGTAARGGKAAMQFAANRAALPALARQIRLRNLSGAILVDLAGLPVRRRAALAPDLATCLATDPLRPRLLGFSHLGLAEILRARGAAPLHELLAGPLAAGLAALRTLAAGPGRRACLRAAPGVINALQADPVALGDLARRTTYPLILRSEPAFRPNAWIIEDAP